MIKRLLLLLIMLLVGVSVYAQNTTATGSVRNASDASLEGVTVTEKGTSNTTVTDATGTFTLSIKPGAVLEFSYLGYDKQEQNAGVDMGITLSEVTALQEVSIIGSRNSKRTATQTAVPVDILDITTLKTISPQVNLNQMLNYVAPSFNSNVQNIADGSDHVDPASLRGLGPDQVLVLINGKRRHTSSLVNINGTYGRGNVGTDMNAISPAAVERIEILRDGAAAQYGSDAIAGVINIVLKKNINQLNVNVTSNANFSKNANKQTGGVDGASSNIAINYGIGLGKKGGFINFAGDFDVRNAYNRNKAYEGQIFTGYNAVEWQAQKSGYDISTLQDNLADIQKYAQGVPYFDAATKNNINNATDITGLRNILNTDVTNNELAVRGQNRSDYTLRLGQSGLIGGRFFANFALPLDDKGTELYAFSGFSSRDGNSAGFYRRPSQNRTYTPLYINGFLPEINSSIVDKSISVGIKGEIKGWKVDFSNTYGINSFLYTIGKTSNASSGNATPTIFDAGGHDYYQNTTNLDISRFFPKVLSGLNIAWGGAHRLEGFDIFSGEESSYAQYNKDGIPAITDAQRKDVPTDFFGTTRPGGAQVFPGYRPANAVSRTRASVASYVDLELDVSKKLLVSGAARFEYYSDFGPTVNFKLAGLYKITDRINIRASGNTGFRAPSLQQLYFSSTSTQFSNGVPRERGTFTNDSKVAKALGIPQLKQETSKSVSVGITAKLLPKKNLTITVDAYFIRINDRVVLTNEFTGNPSGTPAQVELQNTLNNAGASRALFFANAINTETKGLDVIIAHVANLSNTIRLRSELSGAFYQTQKVGDVNASDLLRNAGQLDSYFGEASRIYLENVVPRTKANLSFTLSGNKWNVFLRNMYFGSVTEATDIKVDQQVYSPKIITDLSVGYNINKYILLSVGSNNLFDIYPDKVLLTNGTWDSGNFDYSRTGTQFGLAGRNLFARIVFNL